MARMTSEEILVARVNALERQLELLLRWAGLDEDWTSKDEAPAIVEEVHVRGDILRHTILLLEETVPGFSIRKIRERMLFLHEASREGRASLLDLSPEVFEECETRWRKIMTDLLPPSIYDEPEPPGFRPVLVHSKSDPAPPAAARLDDKPHVDE